MSDLFDNTVAGPAARGETMYWRADANTPAFRYSLSNLPESNGASWGGPHGLTILRVMKGALDALKKAGWLRNRTGTGNRNRRNRFSRNRKRNRNRRNRFPGTETGTGTVLSFKNALKHRKTLFAEEPPEPKTGTA